MTNTNVQWQTSVNFKSKQKIHMAQEAHPQNTILLEFKKLQTDHFAEVPVVQIIFFLKNVYFKIALLHNLA